MLEQLVSQEAGDAVERAIAAVLAEGKIRTADLGGTSTTSEVGDAVLAHL